MKSPGLRLRSIYSVVLIFAFAVCTGSSWSAPAKLQDESDQQVEENASATAVDPRLRSKLRSPRQTMLTFLQAMRDDDLESAAICLDLSQLDPDTASTVAHTYAAKLYHVLQMLWDTSRVWDVTDLDNFDRPFELSEVSLDVDLHKAIDARQIVISRSNDQLWRFSPETLNAIDTELWRRWQDAEGGADATALTVPMWIELQFPKGMRQIRFLLPTYQWICLIILAIVGFAVDIAVRYLLNLITNFWFRIVRADVDYKAQRNLWKPVSLFTQAVVWYLGAKLIGLPAGFLSVLLVALKFFAVVSAVWTAFRAIELLKSYLSRKAALTPSRYDDLLVPFIGRALKLLVICGGLIFFVDVFELPWKTLLGGFGLGGIALAIAAKDLLGNLFGSVTVLTDRPFEIGDWVVIDDVEGTVETVGMRSSRIRTFYNSVVIMPNSRLTTAVVDNMGKRRYRRIKAMLGLQYDTPPALIDEFCEGVRELIQNHQFTRKDSYYVYLNQFSASSIDVLLYCFLRCPDWKTELRERHRLFSDILKLAEKLGVSFAFPTQTLHMFSHEPATNGTASRQLPSSGIGRETARQIADDGADSAASI